MQTTITVRHCEISDALRERAITVVERLGNLASRPMEMAVVFDTDGHRADRRAPAARGAGRGPGGQRRRAPITGPRSTGPRRSSGARSSGLPIGLAGAASVQSNNPL